MEKARHAENSGVKAEPQVKVAELSCIECRRPWLDGAERWRLKVTEDESPETVPYCPECATGEFGPAVRCDR